MARSPVRIARVVGFGTRPPQEFDSSPVVLGTASGCGVKFDAVFDRGVEPRHAVVEWGGSHWVLRDFGTAGGTWVDGSRLGEGGCVVEGPMEVALGAEGPRVRLEPVAVPAMAPMAAPAASSAPVAGVPVRKGMGAPALVPVLLAVAGLVALAGGIGIYFYWKSQQRPTFVQALDQPPPAWEEPPPMVASTASAGGSKAGDGAEATGGTPPRIPDEVMAEVEKWKDDDWQKALREYWEQNGTRSPYVRAILKHEDLWLAKQVPWLAKVEQGGGDANGKGLDFPGALVPEGFYPDADLLGVPVGSADVSRMVTAAVSSQAGAANVASLANRRARAGARFPDRSELAARLRDYSLGTSRNGGEESAGVEEDAAEEPDGGEEVAAGGEPKAYGLMVGINGFDDPSANLVGCRNDVGAQAKILATQGIFLPENIRMMTDALEGTPDHPNKANVVRALKEMVERAGEKDILYIAFSTHGAMDEEKGDAFLLMADMENLYGAELMEILSKAKAKNILITMDACHTGGMPGIGASQFDRRTARRGPAIPESFYEMLGASRGHVVIRACRADQTTPDIQTMGHGVLTLALVAGLSGDADANGDGIVTLGELRVHVTTAIPKISKLTGEEVLVPTFTSGSFGEAGDLPLTVVQKAEP